MKRILFSALTALTALTATPSLAGGSVSVEITPSTPDEELGMRIGLGLLAFAMAQNGDANVVQNGNGNAAGIGQQGGDDFGLIVQDGDNNSAMLDQGAGSNAYGVFQFGEGNDAAVAQSGGETGILLQFGW